MSSEGKDQMPERILLPGTEETVENIRNEMGLLVEKSKKQELTLEEKMYGHGIGGYFGQYALGGGESIEEKRTELRKRALNLIDIYGDKIINLLTPELKEALGI